MLRWEQVDPVTISEMTVKMYRPPFEAGSTLNIQNLGWELDHYAYKHLGSELFMYKILDTNWVAYMEERGDVNELPFIEIPVSESL
ncbi:hypothetical protein [Leptospira idonii]|uniref:Uncharacterized protein n=1 Tax=Leptospira idonii TaxID=1193500 RepID=A0A4R9M213_9LEPT|nr:hypothetical protein [Leptospira idonii]TGN20824.1 hypothetical protein EHS15_01945 [Leptospira idonii]